MSENSESSYSGFNTQSTGFLGMKSVTAPLRSDGVHINYGRTLINFTNLTTTLLPSLPKRESQSPLTVTILYMFVTFKQEHNLL